MAEHAHRSNINVLPSRGQSTVQHGSVAPSTLPGSRAASICLPSLSPKPKRPRDFVDTLKFSKGLLQGLKLKEKNDSAEKLTPTRTLLPKLIKQDSKGHLSRDLVVHLP